MNSSILAETKLTGWHHHPRLAHYQGNYNFSPDHFSIGLTFSEIAKLNRNSNSQELCFVSSMENNIQRSPSQNGQQQRLLGSVVQQYLEFLKVSTRLCAMITLKKKSIWDFIMTWPSNNYNFNIMLRHMGF